MPNEGRRGEAIGWEKANYRKRGEERKELMRGKLVRGKIGLCRPPRLFGNFRSLHHGGRWKAKSGGRERRKKE